MPAKKKSTSRERAVAPKLQARAGAADIRD